MRTLPVHIAVHYLGCAAEKPEGVAMRSAVGPYIEALAEHVKKVTVVAYDPPATSHDYEDLVEFIAQPRRGSIRVCSIGSKGSWKDYALRRQRVYQIVARASRDWDLLLFRMPNRCAGLVFSANRCPRIVTMTGGYVPGVVRTTRLPWHNKLITRGAAQISEAQFRRIARKSGLLYTNSETLLERYRPLFPHIRLQRSTVFRSIDAWWSPDRMLGPCVKFFYAGKLTQAKGVFELIEAFARVRREVLPSAELHIAGTGDAAGEVERLVRAWGLEGSVRMHGWVAVGPDLFELYRQMDVFLFLSHVEGFPKVVWEAMASSLPVICTPVGGLPDVFSNGAEVLFGPVGNPAAVVDAVGVLHSDAKLRQRLIANGYRRAREATLERVIGQLLEHVRCRWPELQRNTSDT